MFRLDFFVISRDIIGSVLYRRCIERNAIMNMIRDDEVTTDELELISMNDLISLLNEHKDMRTAANKCGLKVEQLYRSCVKWHVNPIVNRRTINWNKYRINYDELVHDYENGTASHKDMKKKYGVNYRRIIDKMNLHRTNNGIELWKLRRSNAISERNRENNTRKINSELETMIDDALNSDDSVNVLLSIDVNNVSNKANYIKNNGIDNVKIINENNFCAYKHAKPEHIDEYHMTDPYIDGGILLTEKAFDDMDAAGMKSLQSYVDKYDVDKTIVHRSAFYWHRVLARSTGEISGDYGEFVQDYVDGRLGNDVFNEKYGGNARKLAYARMGLKRSESGKELMKKRQGGTIRDERIDDIEHKKFMIADAMMKIITNDDIINPDVLQALKDGGKTNSSLTRNGIPLSSLLISEYDTGIWLDGLPNGFDKNINPHDLKHMLAVEFKSRIEIAKMLEVSRETITITAKAYGIAIDYTSDEYKKSTGTYYHEQIDDYDSMKAQDKRKATYELKTGVKGGPLANPDVRMKANETMRAKTGYDGIGMQNPIIRQAYVDKCEKDGKIPFNFNNPEWMEKYGTHGLSTNDPSENEQHMINMLKSIGYDEKSYKLNDHMILDDGMELDFLFIDKKFAIEISPTFTHNSNEYYHSLDFIKPKTATYHYDKYVNAYKHEITLLTVFDWMNADEIDNYLRFMLNNNHENNELIIMESNDDNLIFSYKKGKIMEAIINDENIMITHIMKHEMLTHALKPLKSLMKKNNVTKIITSNNMPINVIMASNGFIMSSAKPSIGLYIDRQRHDNNIMTIHDASMKVHEYRMNNDINNDIPDNELIETMLPSDARKTGWDLMYDCGTTEWTL